MRYKTREITISATQWQGTTESYHDLLRFVGAVNLRDVGEPGYRELQVYDSLQVFWAPLHLDDFVIKGYKGEFFPVDKEAFFWMFEQVGHSDFNQYHAVLRGGVHDGKLLDEDVRNKSTLNVNGVNYRRTNQIDNGRVVYEHSSRARTYN